MKYDAIFLHLPLEESPTGEQLKRVLEMFGDERVLSVSFDGGNSAAVGFITDTAADEELDYSLNADSAFGKQVCLLLAEDINLNGPVDVRKVCGLNVLFLTDAPRIAEITATQMLSLDESVAAQLRFLVGAEVSGETLIERVERAAKNYFSSEDGQELLRDENISYADYGDVVSYVPSEYFEEQGLIPLFGETADISVVDNYGKFFGGKEMG